MNRIERLVRLGSVGLLLVLALLLPGSAAASTSSVFVVASYFDSINAARTDATVALFADDAVLAIPARGETYVGREAIGEYLRSVAGGSRRYDIVELSTSGNTLHAVVDVSDHGVRWAQQTVDAVVEGQSLQSLTLNGIRLLLR